MQKRLDIKPVLSIIPRPEHSISREDISESALKVLYRLKKAGFAAYLVGGGVRDLLLAKQPKDFDVATDAHPEEVRALFRNSRVIGRRFRLVHVRFGREIIEVATFRGHHEQAEHASQAVVEEGLIIRDNVFGSLEDDAWRRDFTINALYYNIADFSVVDYTDAMIDLRSQTLRMIGEPAIRLQEDPVRMLRAIRFAAKLDFSLEEELERQVLEQGERLELISPARLFEEVLKLFLSGYAEETFGLLCRYQLFPHLFAQTAACLNEANPYVEQFITQALFNTDRRIKENKPVTPAFLFAALLWPAVQQRSQVKHENSLDDLPAMQEAGGDVIDYQLEQIAIPKRFRQPMLEIWGFQTRLENRRGKRPLRLLGHPRFRAAYDFLLLRNSAGESLQELCDWWTALQEVGEDEQHAMCKSVSPSRDKGRRRRKSKKKSASIKQQ